MRPVRITTNYLMTAEGSALIEVGHTRVLCAASVEETVPQFLRGSGRGWVTAEYSMLPRATATRTPREVTKGRPSGRTLEIQRLIGRSLRSVVDMAALGDRTVIVDCDVLQADGGTRTASITGAYVALVQALQKLVKYGALKSLPVTQPVAATSVGILRGEPLLDLCYEEDSAAEVDMNLVMTGSGRFVELQATAEKTPFDDAQLEQMIALARRGIARAVRNPEGGAGQLKLYCATTNPGKLREFQMALESRSKWSRCPASHRSRLREETGATFEENADPEGAVLFETLRRIFVRGRFGPGSGCARRRARRLLGALCRPPRDRCRQQSTAARSHARRLRSHGAIRLRRGAGGIGALGAHLSRRGGRPACSKRRAEAMDSGTIRYSFIRPSDAPSAKRRSSAKCK